MQGDQFNASHEQILKSLAIRARFVEGKIGIPLESSIVKEVVERHNLNL
jgi:hypothetical protein